MSTLTGNTLDTDVSILEDLNLDMTPKCDADDCDNDATHTIRCSCIQGVEFTCWTCAVSMQEFKDTLVIRFDPEKSCGHHTPFAECTISPL